MSILRPVARARSARLLIALACLLSLPATAQQPRWPSIAEDGLRDPKGPATKILQQPAEALSKLAPDTAGNQVRWVEALKQGQITPRSSLKTLVKTGEYDKDVFLNLKGGMPAVRFPHSIHNEWLDCSNCHDHLFKKKRGATAISMFLILQGEQCGVCHGAVAFPLTECSRCHSMKREDALAELAQQEAEANAEATSAAARPPSSPPTTPRTSPPAKR